MSVVCPITGLPIRYGEPVVALLFTAASSRVAATPPATPTDVWVPRVIPLRGKCGGNLRIRFDPSQANDLWTEGLRIDAVPRRARGGQFGCVGPRAGFDDFVGAARAGVLRVRAIENAGMPAIDPGIPTRSRVAKILATMERPTESGRYRFGWRPARCAVFGFVEVDLWGETREGADEGTEAIIAASSARGWKVWARHASDYLNERTLVIGPADVADAACGEVQRLGAMQGRGSLPVALALYSRAGWAALATKGAVSQYVEAINEKRARWSTGWVREIAAEVAALGTPPSAPDRVREAIRLRELARSTILDVVRDGFCSAAGAIDLRWSLARIMERRHDGAWSEALCVSAERALAEVLAVNEALRAVGRQWSINSIAGDCVTVDAVQQSAAFTVREARRRLAAQRADAAENGDE